MKITAHRVEEIAPPATSCAAREAGGRGVARGVSLIFAHMLRERRAERGVGPVSTLRGKAKAATPRRTP
jgi:hypothetical protein